MCGIIGVVGKNIEPDKFEKARDALAHRGPDGAGAYYEDNCALGHRRLAIIDLREVGKQPMESSDGRFVIVFNGEIYNYLEIKSELKEYTFKSNTDTEVLLAAYQKWRRKCLEKLNGMFAFAIWDKVEKKLFCARDRLGVKPFFYHLDGPSFSFASEIKGLLALDIKAIPNEGIIYDYLRYGLYDHTDETFFTGIKSLPSGQCLIWQNGQVEIKKYWDAADIAPRPDAPAEEVREEFKHILADSIKLRFRSDVPVGLNLSSGLDSNSIYHYALQVTGGKLNIFSMCSPSSEYSECEILGNILTEEQKKFWRTSTLMPKEVFARARALNRAQDQPFGGIPTLAYDKMTSDISVTDVIVLLEGQGVDEILGGYAYYRNAASSLTLSQDTSKLVYDDVLEASFASQHRGRGMKFPEPFAAALLNAQYRDLRYTKLPRVLRFNDHATMAYGRELRLPFLDYRIVEFCLALPAEYKIRGNNHKVLLRDIMQGIVPDAVLLNQKKGFGAIQTEWFRKYYQDNVYALLNSDSFRSRPFWDHKKLRERVDAFYRGAGDNSFFLWQCFNLEMWFREFID